jgi:hypothetical protein
MKITNEKYHELSDKMLSMCRLLDDMLQPKGGWQGWTTSGMRTMTNSVLQSILAELGVEIERDEI